MICAITSYQMLGDVIKSWEMLYQMLGDVISDLLSE